MPMYDEVKTLISGHLEDLRDNRLPAIQRKTGYTIPRFQDAWNEAEKAQSEARCRLYFHDRSHRYARCLPRTAR